MVAVVALVAAAVAAAAAFGGASRHAACNLRPRKAGGISRRLIYIYIYKTTRYLFISRYVCSSSWGNDGRFPNFFHNPSCC